MTRGQRLIKLRKLNKLTQEQLAALLDVTQGTITKLENDQVDDSIYFLRICKLLNCDLEWLQSGKGHPPYTESGIASIPKGYISILSWHDAKEYYLHPLIAQNTETQYVPMVGNGSARCYGLRIKDNSMTTIFPGKRSFIENNVIIVDPEKHAKNGDYIIAFQKDADEVIFKQYIAESKHPYLISLNPQYPIVKLRETTKICGVVVASLDIF